MDWIDKLNNELQERRDRLSTPEAKEESEKRKMSWIGSQGGRVAGISLRNQGKGLFGRTDEEIKLHATKGGKKSAKLYNGKFLTEFVKDSNNKNILSEAGRKGGNTNIKSGHLKKLNEKYAKENSKYFDHDERVCPNCQRKIKGLGMYSRFHGDNCKYLDKINKQKEILSSLPTEFNSNDISRICKELNFNRNTIKYGILKDERYIEKLHSGTNQVNPSIFKKLYKE